jgi:hypothetical protein
MSCLISFLRITSIARNGANLDVTLLSALGRTYSDSH